MAKKLPTTSQNDVRLTAQGVIEIAVVGDQDADSVRSMGEETLRLAGDCRRRGCPVLVLDNLLRMGAVPPEGRKVVVEYGKIIEYDRLAMVGKGAVLRLGANLLIQAVGKGEKLRYFEDRQEAVQWLRAHDAAC